jgi:uncharacterized membrane protein
MSDATRLDAFTDASFAFAVSLMVVGAGGVAPDYAGLLLVMKAIPSFAIGFAIIAMFWFAHVRWREVRGDSDWRSVVLTFLLILSVLIYVHPLRAMSASFAAFLSGSPDSYGGHMTDMFRIYGIGFSIMGAIVAALYVDALRNPDLDSKRRHEIKGEMFVWLILVTTGIASTLMTATTIGKFSPFAYASLPVTIMIFVSWWNRQALSDKSDD